MLHGPASTRRRSEAHLLPALLQYIKRSIEQTAGGAGPSGIVAEAVDARLQHAVCQNSTTVHARSTIPISALNVKLAQLYAMFFIKDDHFMRNKLYHRACREARLTRRWISSSCMAPTSVISRKLSSSMTDRDMLLHGIWILWRYVEQITRTPAPFCSLVERGWIE